MTPDFDIAELEEITSALDQRVWMLVHELEAAIRVLVKANPKWGRDAINKACEMVASLASESQEIED